MQKPHAVVVGAGIGGIAAAIRLKKKGYQVTVYETADMPGGKLTQFSRDGFRFDMGPSLFTLPHLVDELFALCGKNVADYFSYQQLSVITRYFYEDQTVINAYAHLPELIAELRDKLGEDEKALRRFFRRSRDLYHITREVFLENSLHKLSTYLRKSTLRSMTQLHKLDAFKTMHGANANLFKNPKTVQLFDRYATYNGSNPYMAPATLNIIAHLEHELGAFFPEKGMYAITDALYRLAQEIGVDFRFNTAVEQILTQGRRVSGVRVNGAVMAADLVVSNADVTPTYRKLLPHVAAPDRLLAQPKSSSALIFYWAVNQPFPSLDLHNIFYSKNYAAEFKHLAEGAVYEDPTVYVFVSAKAVPTDAPAGKENWFVMINTPNNSGQDWAALAATARNNIIAKLSRILGTEIEQHILWEEKLDPVLIESRTSSAQGALYGNSSNNKFAAFLRHPNFSQRMKGLYFCGGSVHPGGGVPLCLLSAKIATDLVEPV